MPRKKQVEAVSPEESVDHFRLLVQECIKSYEKLNNDSLTLDICKVSDKRLRALILDDEEYKRETKSIYAQQRLAEIMELEHLASLASSGEAAAVVAEEDDEYVHPSDRGKKKRAAVPKKSSAVDRDMLNIQLKTAQMKRELRKEMFDTAGDLERDAVNFIYITSTREDLEAQVAMEMHKGVDDAKLKELLGTKEDIPVGISGKLQNGSLNHTDTEVDEDEDFFEVSSNGELIER